MLQLEDARFKVLEYLLETGRLPESVLAETLEASPSQLREVLRSLRHRDLVEVTTWDEEPIYRSTLELDVSLGRSFVRFLVSVLRLLRTLRKRPSWHSSFAKNFRHRLSGGNSVKLALWELYLDYASGRVQDNLGVLVPTPSPEPEAPKFTFSSSLRNVNLEGHSPEHQRKEKHRYRAVMN